PPPAPDARSRAPVVAYGHFGSSDAHSPDVNGGTKSSGGGLSWYSVSPTVHFIKFSVVGSDRQSSNQLAGCTCSAPERPRAPELMQPPHTNLHSTVAVPSPWTCTYSYIAPTSSIG